MFDVLLADFLAAADAQKAEQMAAYMRQQFEFLGIQSVQRKALCKKLYQEARQGVIDWEFVTQCWASPYREMQYVAIGYLSVLKHKLTPDDIPKIKILAQTKSWWDTIDGLDRLLGELAVNYPEVKALLLTWSQDEDFWLRRIAIDHQLLRKKATDTELLEKILVNNLAQTEFFINKAIGWSLRDYSKTDPEWVRQFIARHRAQMAPLSIREGSKYL